MEAKGQALARLSPPGPSAVWGGGATLHNTANN